jgi:hypothetical protein
MFMRDKEIISNIRTPFWCKDDCLGVLFGLSSLSFNGWFHGRNQRRGKPEQEAHTPAPGESPSRN